MKENNIEFMPLTTFLWQAKLTFKELKKLATNHFEIKNTGTVRYIEINDFTKQLIKKNNDAPKEYKLKNGVTYYGTMGAHVLSFNSAYRK